MVTRFIIFLTSLNILLSGGKLIVSIYKIETLFEDLINQNRSREEIAGWALEALYAEDRRELIYEPKEEEDKIWKAIIYLTGVDLLVNEEGCYLHSLDDFIDFKNELDI